MGYGECRRRIFGGPRNVWNGLLNHSVFDRIVGDVVDMGNSLHLTVWRGVESCFARTDMICGTDVHRRRPPHFGF